MRERTIRHLRKHRAKLIAYGFVYNSPQMTGSLQKMFNVLKMWKPHTMT